MAPLLLRLGGRAKAAWEEGDIDTVLEREFEHKGGGPDLRPSVYEIAADTPDERRGLAVQVHAEHGASFLDSPPRRIVDVDVEGLVAAESVISSSGQTMFGYANGCHREIILESANALRGLVEAILTDWPRRHLGVTKEDVLRYVAERLDAQDDEWLAATADGARAHYLLRYCAKYRARQT